ncbi:hypothetical protein ACR5MH_0595 (plasmid) [Streptomyces sp. L7]|nr:hypothetical protein DOE76_15000 [Leifsonia sp. ku-ls]
MKSNFLSHRLRFLRGRAGISVNAREEAITTPIRAAQLLLIGGVVVALAGAGSILGASASVSAHADASRIQFERDVRASSVVRGLDDDTVALLSPDGDSCKVTTWSIAGNAPEKTVRVSSATTAGACTSTTPITRPTGGDMQADQLAAAAFTYENLGHRTLTFDGSGDPHLESGAKPADVADADWNDLRPYSVSLSITSAVKDLTVGSRERVFTGTTAITNLPAADPNLRYVPPTSQIPTPATLRIASIVRSQSTGTAYSGAREGITVTFVGGVCAAQPTTLTLTYAASSPVGLAPVNTVSAMTLTGAAASLDLAGVQNGSSGLVTLTAACGTGSMTTDASANYHQDVPAPGLTAKQGSSAEQYVLTWTAVSSLATSYEPSWSTSFGTDDQMPETTALTATKTFALGTTYGATITFWVTAGVGDDSAKSSPAAITTAWPATPAGANMTYTRTGYNGNYVSGNVKWNFTGTCPAGTTLQASQLENHAGTTSKTYNNAVQYQGPFTNNLTQVNWGPSYALQGYPYGMGLQTRCASPNGLYSPVVQVQSREWITPMAQPGAPVWNAYNIYTYTAPIYWTHSTCNAPSGCSSLAVNYITYCAAGSNLNSNGWMSTDWNGSTYWHNFGFGDYWDTRGTQRNVTYTNAQYNCATPWGYVSPMSPLGGGVTVTVFP